MKICSIDGCERRLNAKGFCSLHYTRWFRTGSTDGPKCLVCSEVETVGGSRICSSCRDSRILNPRISDKVCIRCLIKRPIEDFAKSWKTKGELKGVDGRKAICKPCDNEAIRDRRKVNPSQYRKYDKSASDKYSAEEKKIKHLKYQYQMSIEEYNNKLEKQAGQCALCNTFAEKLVVDHDHNCCPGRGKTCGQCNRALLCGRCNLALGNFNDDVSLMGKAIEYVQRYR